MTGIATARTLLVGPTRSLRLPSQAAAVARDGDTIRIAHGDYADCAVWHASRLTILGEGAGATFTGKTCQGKAIFVLDGDGTTIVNITFEHATVPDGNGAGIRAEGGSLTVRHSRFLDNEDGILTAAGPHWVILIRDSTFVGNGACIKACAHGLYAGHVALLHIEHSRFIGTRVGHHVKSRASRTELVDNVIMDGPDGTSSYLVDVPNGGDLLMKGNRLEKGPHSGNPGIAVSIGEEGVTQPTRRLLIQGNVFTNDGPQSTVFLRNMTTTPAVLVGNRWNGAVVPLDGPGTVSPPP